MKFYITAILCLTLSCLFGAEDTCRSDCCKTLLTHANELIKKKRTHEGVILYKQVRDHKNATIQMILYASIELKSYQLFDEALIGLRTIISRKDITEPQLLHVGKLLLDMRAIDLAKEAFSKVLAHPVTTSTREYIKNLLENYAD